MMRILIYRMWHYILFQLRQTRFLYSNNDVVNLIYETWHPITQNDKENLWVIILDKEHRVRSSAVLFKGSESNIEFQSDDLIDHLMKYETKTVIIAHNHPSNSIRPSKEDQSSFKELNKLCSRFGYDLLDSIIIGASVYYSLRKQELITLS